MCRFISALFLSIILGFATPLHAADSDRDFSGRWLLDTAASNTRALGSVEQTLIVSQGDAGLLVSTEAARWSYALDGSETRKRIGDESRNSVTKWEGSALIVNTLVSGPQDYTVMDRWSLSRDRNTLTIHREVVRAGSQSEGTLVYRRDGAPTTSTVRSFDSPTAAPARDPSLPTLSKRNEPAAPPDITVPMGTHVLLRLTAEVSTKYAKDGDHVYL